MNLQFSVDIPDELILAIVKIFFIWFLYPHMGWLDLFLWEVASQYATLPGKKFFSEFHLLKM